jgi:hypothetical protein
MSTILHEPVTTCTFDWCTTNHAGDPDGDHTGPFWPEISTLTGTVTLSISTALDPELGGLGGYVYLDANTSMLTPEQAHQAGLALLSAASWAKDHAAATA